MNTIIIKNILASYRLLQAKYTTMQAFDIRGDYESDLFSPKLKKQISIIKSWLLLLTDEEWFVITKHLIDRMTWSIIEVEYQNRWGNVQTRHERTLKRIQARGLEKIMHFIRNSNLENEIEDIFDDIIHVADDE